MGQFALVHTPGIDDLPENPQIILVTPKIQKALKEHRLNLLCSPEEFRRRYPNVDAKFMAIASGASLDTIYNWGVFRGHRSHWLVAPPQQYHQLLLGEASAFIQSF